jgi:xylulose-5-phosphate/fructose-6-phosphate phosphoketolase
MPDATRTADDQVRPSSEGIEALQRYRRAVDYLAVAQIYLQDNCLLEQPLRADHIKPRLLGHWGTCPGLNAVHAGLNRLIRDTDSAMLLLTGPGHGAPEIVSGMVNQYAKFLKVAREDITWRKPISSFNYLLTSEGWRQEHNGYSHQGPGFINLMLNKRASVSRLYLPPDANTLLATLERCLTSTDSINVVIAGKQPIVQWLDLEDARRHCRAGASTWAWASTADGGDPDIVLAAAGTVPTVELMAAADLLRTDLPALRVQVVNVTDLFTLEHPDDHSHGMSDADFEEMFTLDRPVIFNFHGYPSAIHQLVHHRPNPERFHVRGYVEQGTTTTPFDLLAANGVSRFDLAISALQRTRGMASAAGRLIEEYSDRQRRHRAHARDHGVDPPEIEQWQWRT